MNLRRYLHPKNNSKSSIVLKSAVSGVWHWMYPTLTTGKLTHRWLLLTWTRISFIASNICWDPIRTLHIKFMGSNSVPSVVFADEIAFLQFSNSRSPKSSDHRRQCCPWESERIVINSQFPVQVQIEDQLLKQSWEQFECCQMLTDWMNSDIPQSLKYIKYYTRICKLPKFLPWATHFFTSKNSFLPPHVQLWCCEQISQHVVNDCQLSSYESKKGNFLLATNQPICHLN